MLPLFLTSCTQVEQVEIPYYMDEGNIPAQEFPSHQVEIPKDLSLSTVPGVDIDLTQLSSAMVYSLVFQMVFYPEEYVGKTIRMGGEFFVYYNPATQRNYYATIVEDALACCQQGLEFQLLQGNYPEDYPEVGSEIIVTGVLGMYQEQGYENIHLVEAVFSE